MYNVGTGVPDGPFSVADRRDVKKKFLFVKNKIKKGKYLMKDYIIERDGQIEFFENYGIPYEEDNSILIDNTDGVYNGNILEFKLRINNLNKVLFQAIKYLSRMRVKGESVPATILLIDLNAEKAYKYKSEDYRDDVQKIYVGASSKDNGGFVGKNPVEIYDYSDMLQSREIKKQLTGKKANLSEMYMPVDIDENCIVGWAERYYRELPKASKGDFLGDDTGTSVRVTGEIRNPRHFWGHILPYTGKSNEKFKYLMDCLNDRLSKKDLGAFYTPILYAKKAAELVMLAVDRVPEGNDYIILDRCAGTGNLESALIGIKDKNGEELISHCVVSTYEYYEHKVLNERIGNLVRDIIPPTEADVVYENGRVSNADAMSEDFINNPIIKNYIEDKKCTIILFENPPYDDTSSIRSGVDESGEKHKTNNKASYVFTEMSKIKASFKNSNISTVRDFANRFIWSAYKYYLRQDGDSYVVFSPVKYFKSLGILQQAKKKFIKGYLFNRKHFHATSASISCILWSYENSMFDKSYTLSAYDIINEEELNYVKDVEIKEVETTLSASNEKYTGCIELDYASDNKGLLVTGRKFDTISYGDDNIIGYFCPVSASFDLARLAYFNGRGQYVTKDNYLNLMPLFAVKQYAFENWYEKESVFITYDRGDEYTKDKEFLKSCLIYTCLSNQNKCLSFEGIDGRHYQNELCFDKIASTKEKSTTIKTLAMRKLSKMILDSEEKSLIALWNTILTEARATGKCNPKWTYGAYQINKEINTYREVGIGKKKEKKYDYPLLNGNLDTLRTNLKAYYESHITHKLFMYELLK